jgi:23S rRNA (adenine2030-N6)-methyltransferase
MSFHLPWTELTEDRVLESTRSIVVSLPNPGIHSLLSYRHAYHAGNFADVFKHLVLVQCLEYLTRKDKPLVYIDTHAGAAGYALGCSQARMHREYEQGIGRLWERRILPDAVARYLELVKDYNKSDKLRAYPGSPWFARKLLRPQDRLELFELHPVEFTSLSRNIPQTRRLRLHQEDGFKGCIGLLPPVERRGLLLMDPAYERKGDYSQVIKTLSKAQQRFRTGTILIWYPLVDRRRTDGMVRALKSTGIRDVQQFELTIRPRERPGMGACGVLVVNPPWTLFATMQTLLPWLAERLSDPAEGQYRAAVLVAE